MPDKCINTPVGGRIIFVRKWVTCALVMWFCVGTTTAQESQPAGSASKQEPTTETDQEPTEGHKHTNKLATETSPYLLKHAHNPVEWYPWGDEALKKARDENKIIFLSVGYSSCHWCHVMERETFMDEEIAKVLNENFVCIKVDREERPDVDSIYMMSLNIFNQISQNGRSGGWPLSMFITPDGHPFFGGTYFPARDGDRRNVPGFLTIIDRVQAAWASSRDLVKRDAERLAELTRNELSGRRGDEKRDISQNWIDLCATKLLSRFDSQHGGFGFDEKDPLIPKFPQGSNMLFLVETLRANPDDGGVKKMLETTLDQMFQGGIYDHVGGGFHRYSVDRFWHIPHFEKMLYDNGQLLSVYARAYEMLPKPEYRKVCEETAAFLFREMTADDGGFYSALDAESEGEEGKFYRWEKTEIEKALDAESYALYAQIYGLNDKPNFEQKYYSPQLKHNLQKLAADSDLSVDDLQQKLDSLNQKLLAIRDQRVRPLLDSKILTSWNGMMIRGLADAGRILKEPAYLQAAGKAADFVWNKSMVDGRLKRTFTAGEARLNAYLDDYAFFIDGLLALHEATKETKWLDRAVQLQKQQDDLFGDPAGGYFYTSNDHETLLVRTRNPSDGAVPSGNSVSAHNLIYLTKQTQDDSYRQNAKKMIESSGSLLEEFPTIAPRLLIVLPEFAEKE